MNEWETLAADIKVGLESIKETVKTKQLSEPLQAILVDFSK
jgi:hypothetical protein